MLPNDLNTGPWEKSVLNSTNEIRLRWHALACSVIVASGAVVFRDWMGTNRLPIHLFSILAAAIGAWIMRSEGWQQITLIFGLRCPQRNYWLWVAPTVGILTGIFRYVLYRQTGLGGVQMYERELAPQLHGNSALEIVVRCFALLAGTYLAVVVPGLLFLGIIQQAFNHAGWFFIGLLLQSILFGLVHCFMTGTFDLVYGIEAGSGALISGIIFQRSKNLWITTTVMSVSVAVSTMLVAARIGVSG
jgi:membrane protease YdiL (CAAX protease family)